MDEPGGRRVGTFGKWKRHWPPRITGGCFRALAPIAMGDKKQKRAARKAATGNGGQTMTVKALEVRHVFPEDQRAIYANNFVVQHDQSTFSLLFFEVRAPLLLEEGEALKKKVESLSHVDANCVARVVIPANLMPAILDALQENVQKHKAKTTSTSEPVKVNGQTRAK